MMTSRKRNHRGTAYVIVLASALLVTILGLGSMLAVRIQRRTVELDLSATDARLAAQSALAIGLKHVAQDDNWRTTWSNGTWLNNKSLGPSTISLTGVDPLDGDLSDDDTDPLVLTGIAQQDQAIHRTQVRLIPVIDPIDALAAVFHAGDRLYIYSGERLTTLYGPATANDNLENYGTVDGDVECGRITRTGTVTGTLTNGADPKRMPANDVFATYKAKATTLTLTSNFDRQTLSPGYNPWGPTDPNGLYYINAGYNNLTIKDSRIHGTLVIDIGSDYQVILEAAVFMEAARSDYPVLLVNGDLTIRIHSQTQSLSEAALGTNFNPSGAPYQGVADGDKSDTYSNEVRGLIYTTDDVLLMNTSRVQGVVITKDDVKVDGTITAIYDDSYYRTPPEGFTFVSGMQVSPGSYQRMVE